MGHNKNRLSRQDLMKDAFATAGGLAVAAATPSLSCHKDSADTRPLDVAGGNEKSCAERADLKGISAAIPMPIQVVIDDVGWWSGEDGHKRQEPYRTGVARNHVPADYGAVVHLGRGLGMRPLAAMIMCEWDKNNILRKLPTSTWMGADRDNAGAEHHCIRPPVAPSSMYPAGARKRDHRPRLPGPRLPGPRQTGENGAARRVHHQAGRPTRAHLKPCWRGNHYS